jgi:hypothetical protein
MELAVVVLYQRALAHYTVAVREDGTYLASLLKYKDSLQYEPPRQIWFKKQGRHCIGDIDDQELMDDLYHAVQSKMNQQGELISFKKPIVYYFKKFH